MGADEAGAAGDQDRAGHGGQAIASARVPDVILPVLNERAAIPWVLERMPEGYAPLVVDNGSTDGSGELAASLGARVVVEPQPGFGAACFAGLSAAESDVVCFMDCDASFDPGDLPRVADPVRDGTADLMLGARRPTARGAWPVHARAANRVLAFELRRRTHVPLRDLGPMRAAPRERAARTRDSRPPLRLAAGDGAAGGGRGLDDPRGRRRLPPARRPLEGHRDGARNRPRRAGYDETLTVTRTPY